MTNLTDIDRERWERFMANRRPSEPIDDIAREFDPRTFGRCGDCGCRLQSGEERRDGSLCITCRRERTG